VIRCSRSEHQDLFRHVGGGYGLFGVVAAATLRLVRRQQVERVVELCEIDALMDRLNTQIGGGALYGDFQFAIDHENPNFLRTGILSCYVPTSDVRPIPPRQRRLSQAEWNHLIDWAHTDKTRAFQEFTNLLPVHVRPTLLERHASAESVPRELPRCTRRPAALRSARR